VGFFQFRRLMNMPGIVQWTSQLPLKNILSALRMEFLTRPTAQSFESLNSAWRPQTTEIRPFGDTPLAKTGTPKTP
jgi:hypothetical protein